jgi:hypothetical protein
MRFTLLCEILACGCLAFDVGAAADPPPAPAVARASAPAEAPSPRVGRVGLIAGKVEFRGAADAQWSPAAVNDPVATGVAIRSDAQARAQLRIGGDTVEVDGGTELGVVKLDPAVVELALRQGRIAVDVFRRKTGETIEIDMPRGGVWLLQPGRYDIDSGNGERPAHVAVFSGGAHFAGGGGADYRIAAGSTVDVSAASKGPGAATPEPAAADDFTQWCDAHSIDESRLTAPYFVSRDITGYESLDEAGSWRAVANYGEVWSPDKLPADWAPYRDGHWRFLAPWGWTWVDDQPWGFATMHYGRWFFADGKWSWVPGRVDADAVWAPAVVAFLGTRGVGLSYADGPGPAAAWFPLAPGEIFWPSYTTDLDYIQAINHGAVADLAAIRTDNHGEPAGDIANAHFANRAFASAVPRAVFVGGDPVAPALVTIPDERLRDAPVIIGSSAIGPPPPPAARVAVAHNRPATVPLALAAGRHSAWASAVRAAALRSQRYQQLARLHFAHRASPETARPRHGLVLRMARADHGLQRSEAPRKVFVQW